MGSRWRNSRNLFARTAYVGFRAADLYLGGCRGREEAAEAPELEAVRRRLVAYRDKYTVYDEIILLDTAGNVLVQKGTLGGDHISILKRR